MTKLEEVFLCELKDDGGDERSEEPRKEPSILAPKVEKEKPSDDEKKRRQLAARGAVLKRTADDFVDDVKKLVYAYGYASESPELEEPRKELAAQAKRGSDEGFDLIDRIEKKDYDE